jgi:hypothetical protein
MRSWPSPHITGASRLCCARLLGTAGFHSCGQQAGRPPNLRRSEFESPSHRRSRSTVIVILLSMALTSLHRLYPSSVVLTPAGADTRLSGPSGEVWTC